LAAEPEFAEAVRQALLRAGADLLTATPKQQKLYKVLSHTFFEPSVPRLGAGLKYGPWSALVDELAAEIERCTAAGHHSAASGST
jgi:hypothetical protein